MPAFDAERAWRHLEVQVAAGPRPAGSPALETTRQYLEKELRSYGLTPLRESFKANTPVGEIAMTNVYADLVPKDAPANSVMLILGSHYDTKRFEFPFVGANDGGSSTAVLLELARVIAAGEARPVTYRFLFLDGEEALRATWHDPDNRYGSKHHAAQLKASGAIPRVKAFVLLDMVGDKDLKIRRDQYSSPWLLEFFAGAARDNGLGAHVDGTLERVMDDHLSFLEYGVPSVDLIDFDYGPDNAWWHTADDTLEHCSKASLATIGAIVLHGLPAVEERVRAK